MDNEYTDKLLQTVRPAAPIEAGDEQAILHGVYSAVVQGDFEAFGESLTDDVELDIRGFGPLDGRWRGRSEVVAATRRNFALLGGQQPEIDGIIAQAGSIAVLLRESGVIKSTGQAYSLRGVQWFTFENGKIKRIDEIIASIWKAAA